MVTVNQIIKDIKTIKIQGATNVALAGINAWNLSKNKKSTTSKLIKARATEPMLRNCLKALNSGKYNSVDLKTKIKQDKEKIKEYGLKALPRRKKLIVSTHCHSGTVTSILIYAKKKKRRLEVHNTETRPLYQGRTTAKELARAKIPVVHYVDSGALRAMKEADLFMFGADWISKKGVANKIGTEDIAEVADHHYHIPIYCSSHSWKYMPGRVKIEQRNPKEVWPNAPKGIKIRNPAFEIVPTHNIKKIISELGVLSPAQFFKKVEKTYPMLK
jgi:ribose 1,5-bisphosphate isomerase